jgi:DNA-binding response OmpR family regulator
MRLLVIEDEERIASFLQKGLRANGFAVDCVGTGSAGLDRAAGGDFALIVLDLRLPDMDGLEVLRLLRSRGDETPVLVLSSRSEIDDRIEGLNLGADDYLTKPFSFDELIARVHARMRHRPQPGREALEAGGVHLDLRARRAVVHGREVDLTLREFALLEAFLRHPDQVLSREQLLSRVWGYDFDPGTNVVDVYVRYLRRKLGDASIETTRGVGYRFVGVVPTAVRR